MKLNYLHNEIPELSGGFLEEETVKIGQDEGYSLSKATKIAMFTVRMANLLGIKPANAAEANALPYDDSDTLVFSAPTISALLGKNILFLRGWKQFDSCVKGFNSLGLMAEHVLAEIDRITALSVIDLVEINLDFLRSRKDTSGNKIFTEAELATVDASKLLKLSIEDVAIWSCFATKTIVCSTSSNMGISCHQALRMMQNRVLEFNGKSFTLLNNNEGSLIIWCPDERADFMNEEKTFFLRQLENEEPKITKLRTYINRQQRDPGALTDALMLGGYFFPTNPQSVDEMQNLMFVALKAVEKEQKTTIAEFIKQANIKQTFRTIGVSTTEDGKVVIHRGVESGLYGLMAPYFIVLEEFLKNFKAEAISVWNQASIGAALAAIVLADAILHDPIQINDDVRSDLNSLFPGISKFLDSKSLGTDVKTRIHGVFDLANLQSLAQLLGVVVENHSSGRGTAFVGLGSSSYANGNRCYEILKDSISSGGAFAGKKAFHVATHTINPFSQALMFAEDMLRYIHHAGTPAFSDKLVEGILRYSRKPEPAGSTSLSGYMLSRFDAKTLSMVELAYVLKLLGFNKQNLLEFANYRADQQGMRSYLQEAYEEGPNMYNFAKNMLLLLEWSLDSLEAKLGSERIASQSKYSSSPIDDASFEELNSYTALYLTGDNCRQPSFELSKKIAGACYKNLDRIKQFVAKSNKETNGNIFKTPNLVNTDTIKENHKKH